MKTKTVHSIGFSGIPIDAEFLFLDESSDWKKLVWRINIGSHFFEYSMGIGHLTPYLNRFSERNKKPENSFAVPELSAWVKIPKGYEILECLLSDARAGEMTFEDFCSDFGYSDDSIKALETYRACQKNSAKLRKAVGLHFDRIDSELQQLRDEGLL